METAATVKEKTTAAVGIAATTEIEVAVETIVVVAGAFKVFKEGAIIALGKETATVAARISKKGSAASFNKGEKYI